MKFLFDLGGVFFDWNPKYYYERIFNSKKELDFFLNHVCNDDWNIKQDSGRSIDIAVNELVSKFPNYSAQIKLYYQNHRTMIGGVFQSSIDVLHSLKEEKISCYVLSNWSAETFEGMLNDYPFLRKFDGIIISGKEKMIKPQKEIFQLAIDRYQLVPSETVFIDDKLDNIEASQQFGFKTIHLVDPYKIAEEINKYL